MELAALLLLTASGSMAAEAPPHRFEHDIQAFETSDKNSPPPKGAVLFVGDSTFTFWNSLQKDLPEYTVINRGFGGSTMSDLLFFTDRIVLPYLPRLVVLQEGGNDIHGGKTPEQWAAEIKTFVEKVHAFLPAVPVIIGNITASPGRWSEAATRRHANQLLKDYAATVKNVIVVDFFDSMLGADGRPRKELYVADGVHPSATGYQLRADLLRPFLGQPDKKP